MSTTKYIEKFKALTDMGRGLCCRIHHIKATVIYYTKSSYFTNPDWQKLRQRIEKLFPDVSDLSKIPGYDTFRQQSVAASEHLRAYGTVLLDVIEFKNIAQSFICEFPKEVLDLTLEKHRSLIMLYLGLLVQYMKTILLLARVEEINTLIRLYWVSESLAHSATAPNFSDAVDLLSLLHDPQRSFIDQFASCSTFIGLLILQFQESFKVMVDYEHMRNTCAINPSGDQTPIGSYSKRQLSPRSTLSLYTELSLLGRYEEICMYTFLACPSLLFSEVHFGLFKLVAMNCLALPVYRDVVIAVHTQFESLAQNYPYKKDDVVVPKGFKIKNEMKEIARVASQSAISTRRERRSFLLAELRNLNNFFRLIPGAIAPKFPMVIAAASMAKTEILSYFQLQTLDTSYRDGGRRSLEETMSLIEELYVLLHTVQSSSHLIQSYYTEYFHGADAVAFRDLYRFCDPVIRSQGASAGLVLDAILTKFADDTVGITTSSSTSASSGSHRRAATTGSNINTTNKSMTMTMAMAKKNDLDLDSFRMNCERLVMILAGKTVGQARKSNDVSKFLSRIQVCMERSTYVDSIPELVREWFQVGELFWFEALLKDGFRISLEDCHSRRVNPFTTFSVLTTTILNLHRDCPEEFLKTGTAAVECCEGLLKKLLEAVENNFLEYWKNSLEWEKRTLPIEAGKRIELDLRRKHNLDSSVSPSLEATAELGGMLEQEQTGLPGVESQPGERKSITNVIIPRQRLLQLVATSRTRGRLQVYDREYNLYELIKGRIEKTFESKLQLIVGGGSAAMERHGFSFRRIVVAFRAMQTTLGAVDTGLARMMQQILHRNFHDPSLPAEGDPIPRDLSPGPALIWKLAAHMINFIEQFSAKDSNIVWVPGQRMAAKVRPGPGDGTVVDQYMNKEELVALCTFVGVSGVRVIDFKLLTFVWSKVYDIREFLSKNQTLLSSIGNRNSGNIDTLTSTNKLTAYGPFFLSMVQIGLGLAIREMLHMALEEVQASLCPLLRATLDSAVLTAPSIQHTPTADAIHSLASVVGKIGTNDPGLRNALESLISTNNELFRLLPEGLACCLGQSDLWTSTHYYHNLEAFAGNHHAAIFALARLTCAIYPSDLGEKQASRFLRMSSKIIIDMRCKEVISSAGSGGGGSGRERSLPLRPMTLLPQMFLSFCPLLLRSQLEAVLPSAVIHSSQSDVYMFKQRQNDTPFPPFSIH